MGFVGDDFTCRDLTNCLLKHFSLNSNLESSILFNLISTLNTPTKQGLIELRFRVKTQKGPLRREWSPILESSHKSRGKKSFGDRHRG